MESSVSTMLWLQYCSVPGYQLKRRTGSLARASSGLDTLKYTSMSAMRTCRRFRVRYM